MPSVNIQVTSGQRNKYLVIDIPEKRVPKFNIKGKKTNYHSVFIKEHGLLRPGKGVVLVERVENIRGTQRECGSKPLKHRIVKRILVLKR